MRIVLTLAALLAAGAVQAQPAPAAPSALDAALAAAKTEYPGVAYVVMGPGGERRAGAFGVGAEDQPFTPESPIDLYSVEDATICDMRSSKIASYGALDFAQTKFGSIGIRVEPRLLPISGGVVIGDAGRRGSADALVDQESDFVAYENQLAGSGRFGVWLHSLEPDRRGPWFVRDYGMALYAPTRLRSIHLPQGETWNVALRVAAYDGQLSNERSQQWRSVSGF